jgi:hypothetical protein
MTMKQDIVDSSTVKGTMTLLTSTTTPFATKEDNIRLQEQTNQVIHAAVNTTQQIQKLQVSKTAFWHSYYARIIYLRRFMTLTRRPHPGRHNPQWNLGKNQTRQHQSNYLTQLTPLWKPWIVSAKIKITTRNHTDMSKESSRHNLRHKNPYTKHSPPSNRRSNFAPTNKKDNHTKNTQHWKGNPNLSQQQDETVNICFSNLNRLTTGSNRSFTNHLKDLTTTLQYYNVSIFGMSEYHLALSNPGME